MNRKTKIIQSEEKPIAVEILAEEILKISQAMKKINESRLHRKAIIALIHDQSKLGKSHIAIVLNNLDGLERDWLKIKPTVSG
jgi:hypothetical protein